MVHYPVITVVINRDQDAAVTVCQHHDAIDNLSRSTQNCFEKGLSSIITQVS